MNKGNGRKHTGSAKTAVATYLTLIALLVTPTVVIADEMNLLCHWRNLRDEIRTDYVHIDLKTKLVVYDNGYKDLNGKLTPYLTILLHESGSEIRKRPSEKLVFATGIIPGSITMSSIDLKDLSYESIGLWQGELNQTLFKGRCERTRKRIDTIRVARPNSGTAPSTLLSLAGRGSGQNQAPSSARDCPVILGALSTLDQLLAAGGVVTATGSGSTYVRICGTTIRCSDWFKNGKMFCE
jgi:hypothetical protein